MKIKGVVSVLCVMVLIANMFSLVPAKAFTNESYVSDTWSVSKELNSYWRNEPTVENFDDFVKLDARYSIRTHKTYDLNKTKLLINSLEIPSNAWGAINITEDGIFASHISADESKGELCLLLQKDSSGNLTVTRWTDGGGYTVGTFNKADTYEFEFIVKTDVKYINHSPSYTNEYMFRVNEQYVSSTDTSSWLYTFCNSSVFSNAYIGLGCYDYLRANLKVCDKDTFIAADTYGLYYSGGKDSEGYQFIYAKESEYAITTPVKHNIFDESLELNSLGWDSSYDAAIQLNFSKDYRLGEASLLVSKNNLGISIKRTADSKIVVYTNTKITGKQVELVSFPITDSIEIRFISDGNGGYGIIFNGYYCTNTYISTFLSAGAGENCYVSLSAKYAYTLNARFNNSQTPLWVSDAQTSSVTTRVLENGKIEYSVPWQTTLTTAQKYNALNNIFIMENTYFGTDQRAFILSFSTSHIGTDREDDGASGKLIFDVYTQNNSDGICTGLRVHKGMGSEIGFVPPSESYYIGLCKVDGTYYLKINEELMTSDSIKAFCEKYADNVYVTLCSYNSTMKYSIDIWDLGPGFELSSNIYNVTASKIASVEAYTSANDVLKNINVTKGYELKITKADGSDRTYADLLATNDKLVVTYKERAVGSVDIAVGGELTGDIDILAQDLILLRKQLLGVGQLSGIYKSAVDVNNDRKENILDFISAKNISVKSENSKRELLALVDFAVEVESGKEPVVLQLTDPLVIDSSQARNSELLSEYQKTFWATDKTEENCYNYIRETVEKTNPDLILITGNLVYGEFDDNGTAFSSFVNFMDSLNIPWAPVFGEHDNESAMGADWQCDVLETAKNCLFKQRTLTGNGNYTVGIMQNNKLLRVFYMLDSNGCKNASKNSLKNNHTKINSGFGADQIAWYEALMSKTKTVSPDTKISVAYGVQQSAFKNAFEKYGFTNNDTKNNPINLNKTACCAQGDFGYIGADLNDNWDIDNSVFTGLKKLGVDSVLSGGEAANSASVVWNGVRLQYGQKSSTYGYYNNVTNDGNVLTLYPEDNRYTPLVGGTVMPISYSDGSITNPYIYYCDKAGGDINWSRAVTLYVSDFGALGDGKTDDGNAVYDAMEAFMKCGAGSKLVFENKTYYINDNSSRHIRALNFQNMYNCTVEGNGATILIGGDTVYMSVSGCSEFEIKNLNFDRKIRSHFVGTVTNINYLSGYVDVISDRDFGFYGEYIPSEHIFGFTAKSGVAVRNYVYMDKLTTLNATSLKYRFYADMDDAILGTASNISALRNGDKIVIPTPYIGHCMPDDFIVSENSDLIMKNINVLNGADFVFHVNNNKGKVTFDNVNIAPPADETTKFVTWRDGFHCKSNKGPLVWKNCKAVGLGDDVINISCYMMHVSEVISNNEIKCQWDLTGGGSYGDIPVGSQIEIYDVNTGKLIGETTIKKVIDEASNHYKLSDSLKNLVAGENIRFNVISDAAPNSVISNCDFEGTLRFKGAGGVVENSKLSLYAMMMYPETTVEGPIPRDTIFRNCDFTGTWEGRLEISCLSPVTTWQEGYYRLKNISFENCTGLKKSLFKYKNNFVSSSVDYITITPAIN